MLLIHQRGYPSEAALESGVHLANQGMDESVGVFYQMMDPNVHTIADNGGYEDYKNWIYVGIYGDDFTGPGDDNYSLSFDGVDDYVDLGNPSDFDYLMDSDFSISFNFKVSSNMDRSQHILCMGDGMANYQNRFILVEFSADGLLKAVFRGNTESLTTYVSFSPELNQYYNIVWLRDIDNTFELWVDGYLVDTNVDVAGAADPFTDDRPLLLGSQSLNNNSFFNGYIDNLGLWTNILTESQIQTSMSTELNGDEPGLIGYWNFNEGSGATASDATSNGNDGTIYGATWSTDVPFTGTTTTSALTWSVQAQASLGSYNDNDNYLGVASDATNTFDASYDEVESPASPGSSVSLYFPHEEWDFHPIFDLKSP